MNSSKVIEAAKTKLDENAKKNDYPDGSDYYVPDNPLIVPGRGGRVGVEICNIAPSFMWVPED